MRRFFGPMGSVSRITIESQALRSYAGDPSVRVVGSAQGVHFRRSSGWRVRARRRQWAASAVLTKNGEVEFAPAQD